MTLTVTGTPVLQVSPRRRADRSPCPSSARPAVVNLYALRHHRAQRPAPRTTTASAAPSEGVHAPPPVAFGSFTAGRRRLLRGRQHQRARPHAERRPGDAPVPGRHAPTPTTRRTPPPPTAPAWQNDARPTPHEDADVGSRVSATPGPTTTSASTTATAPSLPQAVRSVGVPRACGPAHPARPPGRSTTRSSSVGSASSCST